MFNGKMVCVCVCVCVECKRWLRSAGKVIKRWKSNKSTQIDNSNENKQTKLQRRTMQTCTGSILFSLSLSRSPPRIDIFIKLLPVLWLLDTAVRIIKLCTLYVGFLVWCVCIWWWLRWWRWMGTTINYFDVYFRWMRWFYWAQWHFSST